MQKNNKNNEVFQMQVEKDGKEYEFVMSSELADEMSPEEIELAADLFISLIHDGYFGDDEY